jgi:Rrf2 family protein
MFRISRRLDYGLQLMIALASDKSDLSQPSAQLSEKLHIPLPFLHQIAHSLMQSGLIKASPGPRGGLRLNGDAESISVLKIAEVLEGPIYVTPCLDCSDACPRQENCTSQYMWDHLQGKIIDHLGDATLMSLVSETIKITDEAKSVTSGTNGKKPVPAS